MFKESLINVINVVQYGNQVLYNVFIFYLHKKGSIMGIEKLLNILNFPPISFGFMIWGFYIFSIVILEGFSRGPQDHPHVHSGTRKTGIIFNF